MGGQGIYSPQSRAARHARDAKTLQAMRYAEGEVSAGGAGTQAGIIPSMKHWRMAKNSPQYARAKQKAADYLSTRYAQTGGLKNLKILNTQEEIDKINRDAAGFLPGKTNLPNFDKYDGRNREIRKKQEGGSKLGQALSTAEQIAGIASNFMQRGGKRHIPSWARATPLYDDNVVPETMSYQSGGMYQSNQVPPAMSAIDSRNQMANKLSTSFQDRSFEKDFIERQMLKEQATNTITDTGTSALASGLQKLNLPGKLEDEERAERVGGITDMMGSVSSMAQMTGQMDDPTKSTAGADAMKGAGKGAKIGSKIGSVIPGIGSAIGAGVGTVIGAGTGIASGQKQTRQAKSLLANRNAGIVGSANRIARNRLQGQETMGSQGYQMGGPRQNKMHFQKGGGWSRSEAFMPHNESYNPGNTDKAFTDRNPELTSAMKKAWSDAKGIHKVQAVADIAGTVPGFGYPGQVVSSGIDLLYNMPTKLAKGDFAGAGEALGWGAVGLLPTAGNYLKKADKLNDLRKLGNIANIPADVAKVPGLNLADEIIDAGQGSNKMLDAMQFAGPTKMLKYPTKVGKYMRKGDKYAGLIDDAGNNQPYGPSFAFTGDQGQGQGLSMDTIHGAGLGVPFLDTSGNSGLNLTGDSPTGGFGWDKNLGVTDLGITKAIGDTSNQVGNALGNVTSNIGDTIGSATSSVGDTLSNVTTGIGDTASNITSNIGDTLSTATQGVGNALGDVKDKVASAVGGAKYGGKRYKKHGGYLGVMNANPNIQRTDALKYKYGGEEYVPPKISKQEREEALKMYAIQPHQYHGVNKQMISNKHSRDSYLAIEAQKIANARHAGKFGSGTTAGIVSTPLDRLSASRMPKVKQHMAKTADWELKQMEGAINANITNSPFRGEEHWDYVRQAALEALNRKAKTGGMRYQTGGFGSGNSKFDLAMMQNQYFAPNPNEEDMPENVDEETGEAEGTKESSDKAFKGYASMLNKFSAEDKARAANWMYVYDGKGNKIDPRFGFPRITPGMIKKNLEKNQWLRMRYDAWRENKRDMSLKNLLPSIKKRK